MIHGAHANMLCWSNRFVTSTPSIVNNFLSLSPIARNLTTSIVDENDYHALAFTGWDSRMPHIFIFSLPNIVHTRTGLYSVFETWFHELIVDS